MSLPQPTRSLILPELWPARIRGGMPHIEFAELLSFEDQPDLGNATTGELVWLSDSAERVGVGIVDRENELLRIWPLAEGESWDTDFLDRRVAKALAFRESIGFTGPDATYRLINGEGDGLAGVTVDIQGQHAILYTYGPALDSLKWPLAASIGQKLGLQTIVAKIRSGDESNTQAEVIFGEEPPKAVEVVEEGVRYEVHLLGGLNCGLFGDMRDLRRSLRTLAKGRRVLNTFSYTGSLSLACALGGAASVTSVDFASGVLAWTKTNFRLNGIDPDERRYDFVRHDVFDYLKESRRGSSGPSFDMVILDPPATTTVPGRRWFLKSDYARLIGHALRVLAPQGILVVADNTLQGRPEQLDKQIRNACRENETRLRLIGQFGLPADHPTQMIYPQSRYLKGSILLSE